MITREEIKKEIDNLPESLLEELYTLLKKTILKKKSRQHDFTIRNFQGRLDQTDVRKSAYE